MVAPTQSISLDALRKGFRGPVIVPGDASYDEARKVWNGDVDRRPAVIARCTDVNDVRAALAYAQTAGLRIAIKAGGHSLPGHCIADGAVMLDLRPMNRVIVDPDARRARVQGGAVWSAAAASAMSTASSA